MTDGKLDYQDMTVARGLIDIVSLNLTKLEAVCSLISDVVESGRDDTNLKIEKLYLLSEVAADFVAIAQEKLSESYPVFSSAELYIKGAISRQEEAPKKRKAVRS